MELNTEPRSWAEMRAAAAARKQRLWFSGKPKSPSIPPPITMYRPPAMAYAAYIRGQLIPVWHTNSLAEYIPTFVPPKLTIRKIIITCANYYNVELNDLLSCRRHIRIVRPRQVAMYLAKILTAHSYPEIGRHMGNRDHTTVLHGMRKIQELMEQDPKLRKDIAFLTATLANE